MYEDQRKYYAQNQQMLFQQPSLLNFFAGRCLHDVSKRDTLAGWHFWREHYWEENENGAIRLLVSGALASVYQKASEQVSRQVERDQKRGANPEKEKQIKLLQARVEALKASKRTDNMLNYVQTLSSVHGSKWDANPWLLGTRQGVIDLRTGTLRAGQPDDHLRTIIPTAWKGLDEPAPRFQQFLRELFSDREEGELEELLAFLQRVLGYGITGHVSEHIFLMLYGEEGRNGKDTLMHVLEQVLGKTVGAVSDDVLISRGRVGSPGAARPHLCNLQGKRIAWVSESNRDARFAIEQIKQLTGGGAIVARQLYAREYTFAPSHLLILLTNYQPEADPADSAFWERLCPVVFNVRFVEKPEWDNERLRDPKLADVLAAEASGILAWLVRGALEWQRLGLAIPAGVRQARQEYHRAESSVQDFISQCCILDPAARTPAHQLYKRYKRWTSENDIELVSNKQFAREIKQVREITCARSKHGIAYIGVRLAKEPE
ncbi:MAG TPA: phage/plasmid primase, P4 family [Ktedonobacteraceae bacterium]